MVLLLYLALVLTLQLVLELALAPKEACLSGLLCTVGDSCGHLSPLRNGMMPRKPRAC